MTRTERYLRDLRRAIGSNIHACRLGKSLPLRKLARRTGLPVWLLDRCEMGRGRILLELVCLIAGGMGVPATDAAPGMFSPRCPARFSAPGRTARG